MKRALAAIATAWQFLRDVFTVLSNESEDLMRKALVSGACGNADQLKRLLGALRGG